MKRSVLHTCVFVASLVGIPFIMKADGHLIPISDDGILFLKILFVMVCIGGFFLLTAILKYLVRKKNLPEPRSYILIMLITLLLAAFWIWLLRVGNLFRHIDDLIDTPVTLLILFITPVLLYRISPKRKKTFNSKNP